MSGCGFQDEIEAKGLTAPRVTPASIEEKIVGEYYFTAAEGLHGKLEQTGDLYHSSLDLLTICVLVMWNGFVVMGKSACASPENFDAELGRKIARQDAFNQIWPLEGYLLREKLST